MQLRETLVLDDAYYDHSDLRNTKAYIDESYKINRGDSIWWARERCKDDDEIRSYIYDLRRQFRSRLTGVFATMLDDNEDPNHFFAMLGNAAEKGDQHAAFLCEKLKNRTEP